MVQVPPSVRPATRVPPDRFQLPVDRMREGYYSDKYFVRTRDVLVATGRNPRVTMQVFQKQDAWLGGVDEAIAILKTCLTEGYTWQDLDVLALYDGDKVEPRESVMHVSGPYGAFAHLETVYLGVLARRTR
jgi:nicotinate phosphoribosyltransferase